jgi:7-cyano-7-deazaguanine tRNA-ribosyltransferase
VASPVFGVIPLEVEDVYPLGQHECPKSLEKAQIEFMKSTLKWYSQAFNEVLLYTNMGLISGDELDSLPEVNDEEACRLKVKAIADYQFGRGAGEQLFHDVNVEKARTGKIRRMLSKKTLLATLRASDGILILTIAGAKQLLKITPPKNRVVVKDDSVEFIEKGKSVFAKFVQDCDTEIRPYQEVIVVDKADKLLSTGTAILNSDEMMAFDRGVAVKTRHRVKP